MDTIVPLIVKNCQFEDKRIEAKASWNIKELKGKLSEIYPTSDEEQKLIYSGKLLNDTVVLKDVLREYEGQEAHTVHLVFCPSKAGRSQSKLDSQNARQTRPLASSTNQSTSQTTSTDMSTSELRQRHTPSTATTSTASTSQEQPQQTSVPNIPSAGFYGSNAPGDINSQMLAQQYAMQTWMQQAYAQYMNQYITLMSSPEAFYQMSQQQQQTQPPPYFAFMPPQMPFVQPPTAETTVTDAVEAPQPANNEAQPAPAQVQQPQPQPAEQRRFPNIIQDEQENRDWLDILYSMSRLMILLCLVYFYSSPVRCLVVILIGISIYLYHIYKQNQNRMNNNNSTRVNLNNVNRPAAPAGEAPENAGNDEVDAVPVNENQQQAAGEAEPLIAPTVEPTVEDEPQVPLLTIVRTFVLSFFSSIIPEAPAL